MYEPTRKTFKNENGDFMTPETKAKIEAAGKKFTRDHKPAGSVYLEDMLPEMAAYQGYTSGATYGYNLAVERITELEQENKNLHSLWNGSMAEVEKLKSNVTALEKQKTTLEARVEKAESKTEFVKQYYNPSDTRFKTLVHNFMELPEEKKLKLIELADTLRKLND